MGESFCGSMVSAFVARRSWAARFIGMNSQRGSPHGSLRSGHLWITQYRLLLVSIFVGKLQLSLRSKPVQRFVVGCRESFDQASQNSLGKGAPR